MTKKVDVGRILSNLNENAGRKQRPIAKWKTEESQEVPMIVGKDPIIIERRVREDSDGIRNIGIKRGRSYVNFDIQSTEVIALVMKQMARGYVPDALTEESIIRDNDTDNISEDVQ